MFMSYFIDREDAGHQLADKLISYKHDEDAIILALPRGGVPIAVTMANELSLPYDLMLVRKLGHPHHSEYAFGAISVGDVIVINPPYEYEDILKKPSFQQVLQEEKIELERRNHYYRQDRSWPDLSGKRVILVDDGIATGATMKAAIEAVKRLDCKKIIVAVPVMPADEYDSFSQQVDELYVCHTPANFRAVGLWYQKFDQISDEEVIAMLSKQQ